MSLRLWMPLMGDLRNQGLDNFSMSTLGTISWVDGKLGAKALQAGNANQTSNGISINSNLTDILADEYSVSVWIKPLGNHVHYNGTILSSGDWNHSRWAFGVNQDNTKVDVLSNGHNVYLNCTVPVNEWTHLVCTCDSSNKVHLYKNGEYIGYTTRSDKPLSDASNATIGRETYASGYFSFNGVIQDLRLYDHCLSEMEVKQLSQGLILHYPLNRQGFGSENLATCTTPLFNISAGTGNYNYAWICGNGTLTIGKTYTFSAEIEVSDNISDCTIYNYQSSPSTARGPINYHFPADGTRHSWTFTAAATGFIVYSGVAGQAANKTAVLRNIKVEENSSATAYIPRSNEAAYNNGVFNSTVEYDTSGYCNNGTRAGTFTWTSDTPKYSVSQVFASGNNYIDCGPSQRVLPTDELTVSLWTNYSTWGNPISCTEGGGWNFENGSSGIRFPVYISGVGYKLAESNITPSTLANGWHMLTGTFDKTNVKIYIDGVLEATTATDSTNGIGYAANHCYVGAEASGSTYIANAVFVGKLSDVRIYATALSADDVKSLYQNCATIDPDGTIRGQIRS